MIQIATRSDTLWVETRVRLSKKEERKQVYTELEKKPGGKNVCDRSVKLVDDLGFMSPKNRNQEVNAGVIGMLLESESEAVARGAVFSARSSCRRRISRMPKVAAKITFQ